MTDGISLIERAEISVPCNENTRPQLDELRNVLVESFGGATRIKSQLGGMWKSPGGMIYEEDIYIFIIYYRPEEIPTVERILKGISKMLVETGEEESWVIYQNAKRVITA